MGPRAKTAAALAAVAAAALTTPAAALGTADLSIRVSAEPASLPLGSPDDSLISIAVSNAGPDPAEEVLGTSTVGRPALDFDGFETIEPGGGVLYHSWRVPPIEFFFETIPPGGTTTLKMWLEDSESGVGTISARTSTITPESNTADNSASADVRVVALEASPSALSFGPQAVGTTSAGQALTVTNGAAIPVQVGSFAVSGGDFTTYAGGCAGMVLAPGADCHATVQFAPSRLGDWPATLYAISPTTDVNPLAVALSGTGTLPTADQRPPSLTISAPRSIAAARFRKGFTIRVTPDEPAALEVRLAGRARRGALASAFDLRLFTARLPIGAGTRTIEVRPKRSLLGPLRRPTNVRLSVVATDAAGNTSSPARTIRVKPSS